MPNYPYKTTLDEVAYNKDLIRTINGQEIIDVESATIKPGRLYKVKFWLGEVAILHESTEVEVLNEYD